MWGLSGLGGWTKGASELALTSLALGFTLLLTLPTLRSRLMRRRLWVNTWMRQRGTLTELLQGGALYAMVTFLLCLPWATLITAELINISPTQALILGGGTSLMVWLKAWLEGTLKHVFSAAPSSLLSREWGVALGMSLCALALIPAALYQPRPDLQGVSLQEALLLTSGGTEASASGGLFGLLQSLVELKEVSFWWALQNLDVLLADLPPRLIAWLRLALGGLYTLYSLSVVYAFSRLQGALIELTDAHARSFLIGSAPPQEE